LHAFEADAADHRGDLGPAVVAKHGQYFLNRIHQESTYAAAVVPFEEPLKAAAPAASHPQNAS
jgi:hypothetical protein